MQNEFSFINIFFEIWIHPRKIIRIFQEGKSKCYFWTMLIIFVLLFISKPFYFLALKDIFPSSVGFIASVLFLTGLVFVYFFLISYTLFWIGKIFGGEGSFKDIRIAFIWSFPPSFVASVLGIFLEFTHWSRIFCTSIKLQDLSLPHLSGWQLFIKILIYLLAFWNVVLGITNVSEAHKISILRSLFSYLVLYFLIFVSAIGIYYCFLGKLISFENIFHQ